MESGLISDKDDQFGHLTKPDRDRCRRFRIITRRSHLQAAIYYYAQALGVVGVSPNREFASYKLMIWYLEAFFLHLAFASEVLLDEINVAYGCGLEGKDVTWVGSFNWWKAEKKPGIRDKLDGLGEGTSLGKEARKLKKLIDDAYNNPMFIRLRWWRHRWRHISTHEDQPSFQRYSANLWLTELYLFTDIRVNMSRIAEKKARGERVREVNFAIGDPDIGADKENEDVCKLIAYLAFVSGLLYQAWEKLPISREED